MDKTQTKNGSATKIHNLSSMKQHIIPEGYKLLWTFGHFSILNEKKKSMYLVFICRDKLCGKMSICPPIPQPPAVKGNPGWTFQNRFRHENPNVQITDRNTGTLPFGLSFGKFREKTTFQSMFRALFGPWTLAFPALDCFGERGRGGFWLFADAGQGV